MIAFRVNKAGKKTEVKHLVVTAGSTKAPFARTMHKIDGCCISRRARPRFPISNRTFDLFNAQTRNSMFKQEITIFGLQRLCFCSCYFS